MLRGAATKANHQKPVKRPAVGVAFKCQSDRGEGRGIHADDHHERRQTPAPIHPTDGFSRPARDHLSRPTPAGGPHGHLPPRLGRCPTPRDGARAPAVLTRSGLGGGNQPRQPRSPAIPRRCPARHHPRARPRSPHGPAGQAPRGLSRGPNRGRTRAQPSRRRV